MCGIVGLFTDEDASTAAERVAAATERLHRRGPDDRGTTTLRCPAGALYLSHTRLPIIDLTSGGHQPMFSTDGRFCLTYNGEIYNYRELRDELVDLGHGFATQGDAEVLLASWIQWGGECLQRLRGMFVFALFDRRARSLVLVRDAFGIKPLYYWIEPGRLAFASEIPALLALLPRPAARNNQRAYDFLVWGEYDDRPETFYEGIRHLMPGHRLSVGLAGQLGLSDERWWRPSIREEPNVRFADAAERLRETFLDSVRTQLRSDVPVGAALSGGIDSSAIVCAMHHIAPKEPIHTFSYVARGSAFDEEHWIDRVNTHVGAIPHKVELSPLDLAADLDDLICSQGEPFGGASIYAQYAVYRRARECGVRVLLDGQGADELFAGYHGFVDARVRSLLAGGRIDQVVSLMRRWSSWPGRGFKQAALNLGSAVTPGPLRGLALRTLGKPPTPPWLRGGRLEALGVAPRAPWDGGGLQVDQGRRRMMQVLLAALNGRGLAGLLRHGDRNAMRFSVENRVPFLTHEIAELVLRLPEDFLLSRHGETKRLLRAALRGIVPDEILNRPDKIGFATPDREWLAAQGKRVGEWLDGAEQVDFLDAPRCRAEVSSILEGRRPFGAHVWRLINYCRWVQLQGQGT